jgi:predicted acyltransferase
MTSAPSRVLSIDALRGLTIALMILVNDPGDWSHVYTQLDHSPWNGFTLTDFVFPNFLFLVGASIILSLQSRLARGQSRRTLALHILWRAAVLFAVNVFLASFPHFHWTHMRIFGVLTRIAVCYLVAGLLCLAVWNGTHRARTLLAIAAALLVGYWALMRFVPVPGIGVPTHAMPILDPDRNLAAWLDRAFNAFTQRWLHTGRLYRHTSDPEGILSTLPAIATTLIGCLTGRWLRRARTATEPGVSTEPGAPSKAASSPWVGSIAAKISAVQILRVLLLAGLVSLALGLLWSFSFPLNKNLWTSSYVLFSAGCSLLLLALCYWLIDIRRLHDKPLGKALIFPWLVFGSNAIFAFVFSNTLVEIMLWIKVPAGALINPGNPAQRITAWFWTYRHLFARHDSTCVTSVAFALAFTAVCFLPNWLLWRKKFFLKI